MPLVVKDRVKETTTTTGTGTITLAGAVTGFQPFSIIGDGNETYYTIAGAAEFEVGIGTLSGTTLSRDTILESSNSGSAVNFSAGSKDVFVTYPAEKASVTFPAGSRTANYTASSNEGVLTDTTGGAFTVTLPPSPLVGAQVVVADSGNFWGTNNLTIGRNGELIGGLAENLVCDITGVIVQLVYDGASWEVYAQIGGNGGTAVTLDGTQTLTNKTLTSPILGGITATASGNLRIDPATQIVEVLGDGASVVGQIQLNCHVNSHGQRIASQPHSQAAYNVLTLPGGTTIGDSNATLVSDIGTQTLTNKTLGATTLSGALSCADQIVNRPILEDYAVQGSAIGSVGATRTFDMSVANFFSATLDQACTFTFSNPPASGDFGVFVLELTNGGAFAITYPASVDFPGGVAPTLTAAGVDQLAFTTRDGGTTFLAFVAGLDIKSP